MSCYPPPPLGYLNENTGTRSGDPCPPALRKPAQFWKQAHCCFRNSHVLRLRHLQVAHLHQPREIHLFLHLPITADFNRGVTRLLLCSQRQDREKRRHSTSGIVQEKLPHERSQRNQTNTGGRKLPSLPVTFGPISASLQTVSETSSAGANDLCNDKYEKSHDEKCSIPMCHHHFYASKLPPEKQHFQAPSY